MRTNSRTDDVASPQTLVKWPKVILITGEAHRAHELDRMPHLVQIVKVQFGACLHLCKLIYYCR